MCRQRPRAVQAGRLWLSRVGGAMGVDEGQWSRDETMDGPHGARSHGSGAQVRPRAGPKDAVILH
eukprot:10237970-Alexandrium_andersonii.AAC.1